MSQNKLLLQLICLAWPICVEAQPQVDLLQTYDAGFNEQFLDVYALQDGGFVVCGVRTEGDVGRPSRGESLAMRINPDGGPDWMTILRQEGGSSRAVSVIETDNGDFVCGGLDGGQFNAFRLSSEGELRWLRNYGAGHCWAVIELKEGNFMLAGSQNRSGLLVKIDGDGEPLWARDYSPGYLGQFYTMRETEGGVVAAGGGKERDRQSEDLWIVKAEIEDGASVWSRLYLDYVGYCNSMTSTGDGGFALSGYYFGEGYDFFVLRVNSQGEQDWFHSYERDYTQLGRGITRLGDSGYALIGESSRFGVPMYPYVIRVNLRGEVRWESVYFEQDERFGAGSNIFFGCVTGLHNEIVACGSVLNNDNETYDGLLMRLQPDILEPAYLIISPEDTTLVLLPDTTLDFSVAPMNLDYRDLDFAWIYRDSVWSTDTLCSLHFDRLGEELVECRVSQEEVTVSVRWHIEVRDFFIRDFAPDSLELSLRRGSSLDFSVEVAAVEGDPINYQWTLANLDNPHPEVISDDLLVTMEFLRSGNYALEAIAGRGESFDVVTWTISVRSAVWSFWPDELSLTVPPDTVINFGVNPFNPESDSLSYAWYFGEDLLGMDSAVDVQFGGEGRVEVTAIVTDGAEVDTLLWNVLVQLPDAVESSFLFPLSSFGLSASPNPFNANTTVSYGLPAAAEIRLTLHDIGGRRVRVLADGMRLAGRHSALLDGSGLPAGVYLIRLEAGKEVRVTKGVLVK